MSALEQQLLNTNVVLMAAGAWFILWVVRKIWKGMDKIEWVSRLKPLYPAVLCQGFVWIPGAMPPDPEPTIGTRILMGLWCGFLASIGYQLIRRFLQKKADVELPENPNDLVPNTTEPEEEEPEEEPDEEDSRDTPVTDPGVTTTEANTTEGKSDKDDEEKKD